MYSHTHFDKNFRHGHVHFCVFDCLAWTSNTHDLNQIGFKHDNIFIRIRSHFGSSVEVQCAKKFRELSSCFGSKRCCSWELVGGPSVLGEPLFAGVLAEVVCTQTLSELLLRKKHMRKHVTCL